MSYYDEIYEIAADNFYLISTRDAAEAGIPQVELAKLSHRGKLENITRGLYRLARYVPHPYDAYAIAVARVGEGAYLYGESVLAMLDLVPTNPNYIYVATPKRTRKKLPASIRLKKPSGNEFITYYEGIPSQYITSAIRSARHTMMNERLREAAKKAYEQGYLLKKEYDKLEKEMEWDEEAKQQAQS